MKLKFVFGIALGLSVLFQSCSKDETDYIKRDEIIKQNGSFSVLIKGTSKSGYALNESYNMNYLDRLNGFIENDSIIEFSINQGTSEVNGANSIDLAIEYNKITKTAKILDFSVRCLKYVDSKSYFTISESYYNNNSNEASKVDLTNFKFDSSAYTIKGNILYSTEYTISSTVKRTMTVTGEFNLSVKKRLNNSQEIYN